MPEFSAGLMFRHPQKHAFSASLRTSSGAPAQHERLYFFRHA